jgi:hypothetical protein
MSMGTPKEKSLDPMQQLSLLLNKLARHNQDAINTRVSQLVSSLSPEESDKAIIRLIRLIKGSRLHPEVVAETCRCVSIANARIGLQLEDALQTELEKENDIVV